MLGIILISIGGVVFLICIVSMMWDTNAIASTAEACARGDHQWCTSKSPWHPPGVPTGSGR